MGGLPSPRFDTLQMDVEEPGTQQYEKQLKRLQKRLIALQGAYLQQGKRAVIVFQGWDAAGKGGAIRRLAQQLDPRGLRVHSIGAPQPDEQGRHYLYRFWQKLPTPGTIAVFDRSWYGRLLVERVEGYARTEEWQRAYAEINQFEKMLTDDGIRLVKLFFHITKDVQLERFQKRVATPHKRWKLTLDDLRNRDKWDEYMEAAQDMFDKTHTDTHPWHLLPANCKRYARLQCLQKIEAELARDCQDLVPDLSSEMRRGLIEKLGLSKDFVMSIR